MTKDQIERFVEIRNRSGFSSNLQFEIDLGQVGLKLADLGVVRKLDEHIYVWKLPFGDLVEKYGTLRLFEVGSIPEP